MINFFNRIKANFMQKVKIFCIYTRSLVPRNAFQKDLFLSSLQYKSILGDSIYA
jgi:hypothetical protein